jgi:hypothetical protein
MLAFNGSDYRATARQQGSSPEKEVPAADRYMEDVLKP